MVNEHVLVVLIVRALEAIGRLVEEVAVHGLRDELEDTENAGFTLGRAAFAEEEELEEALANRVALYVESGRTQD